MSTYTLPFFGELDLDSLEEYYDAEFEHAGRTIYIDLNFEEEGIDEEKLHAMKQNLENLSSIIGIAAKAVEDDFLTAGTPMEYVEHHLEVMSGDELDEILKDADKNTTEEQQLFSILKLYRIGFYPGEENAMVLDFTIGKGVTDYIVVVNMDEEGTVNDIVMES